MDLDYHKMLLEWLRSNVIDNAFGITLNLKRKLNNIVVDYLDCQRALGFFMNRMNRNLLKGKFTRGSQRLEVIPTYQIGSFKERQHYHLVVGIPKQKSLKDVTKISEACWKKVDQSYGKPFIEKVYDDGWLEYSTKIKSRKDLIDCNNLHLETLVV